MPSDHIKSVSAKELLQNRVNLAQELVDIHHDRVRAIASHLFGARPPEPEGLQRLRNMTKELEDARASLVDATCRWNYFVRSGSELN